MYPFFYFHSMMTNREIFLKHVAQTSSFPLSLEIEKAKGIYMYGTNGEEYIDLISGIGVSSVGHCLPEVVEAIKAQAEKYLHLMVYGEFIQTPQVELAQELASTLPKELSSVYLVNSGSEANEGAIKLAKRYTGRSNVISCRDSYHGATHATLSLSDSEEFTQAFRPLVPGITHINFNSLEDLSKINENTACVIIETIQGEAGVRTPDSDYLKTLKTKCKEKGTLLILDEVQCGAGRTGTYWAFEQFDVVPDILTSAKGMGGGMPIGAFISSSEIMQCLTHNPILGHITTFGGHPVSAAGAVAGVKFLKNSLLLDEVKSKAELFKSLLKHPAINVIRNFGLMMAVELDSFDNLQKVIHECIENGLVTDWFLFNDISMRIAPPLIITEEEIKKACKIILQALDKVYS